MRKDTHERAQLSLALALEASTFSKNPAVKLNEDWTKRICDKGQERLSLYEPRLRDLLECKPPY